MADPIIKPVLLLFVNVDAVVVVEEDGRREGGWDEEDSMEREGVGSRSGPSLLRTSLSTSSPSTWTSKSVDRSIKGGEYSPALA
jgi:hypothetical protein